MAASLLSRLPSVRGRYLSHVPLAPTLWFRVGGVAEVTFKPADLEDLCFFLQHKPADIPLSVIGVGSNILVRDGGVPGVVLRLGRGFTDLRIDGDLIHVGAAVLDRTLALCSVEASLTGFEFLCGIPGTLGGALRMNAGAYGSEISQVLVEARAVDPKGKLHFLMPEDMNLTYRHCGVPKDWIFVGATLRGMAGNSLESAEKIKELLKTRETTQPVHSRTGGSTFANPEGLSAWKLIDQAGCRGLQIGAARMSDLHCNFMINTGGATAEDLEALGEEVQRRVLETSGFSLRWEIERLGTRLCVTPALSTK